jgi:tetratricopeptide (TPR) repeat protein
LQKSTDYGLFTNIELLPKLAWIEYLSGNNERAIEMLQNAADRQHGQAKALSLYYRGAILNRLKLYNEAVVSLDEALAERSDLVAAREEKGESLWQLGRRDEAVSTWTEAIRENSGLVLANYLLAGAAASMGRTEAAVYENQATKQLQRSLISLDDRTSLAKMLV